MQKKIRKWMHRKLRVIYHTLKLTRGRNCFSIAYAECLPYSINVKKNVCFSSKYEEQPTFKEVLT